MPVDPPTQDESLRGTETILLVEDDEAVRMVAGKILARYGYDVIYARDEGDAFLECENNPKQIHLLLTDVVMPFMNGRHLADHLVKVRPSLKVLFMSGYTDRFIVKEGVLDPGIEFLQKPLLPEPLARRVRALLDAPPRMSAPRES